MGKTELAKWLLAIVFLSTCQASQKQGLFLIALGFLFYLIFTRAFRLARSFDEIPKYLGYVILVVAGLFVLAGVSGTGFKIELSNYTQIPSDLSDFLQLGSSYAAQAVKWQDARVATAQAQNSQSASWQSAPARPVVPNAGGPLIYPSATYAEAAPSVVPTLLPAIVPTQPPILPTQVPVLPTATPYVPPPVPTLAPPPTIDWQATAQAVQTQTPPVLPTVLSVPTLPVLPTITVVPSVLPQPEPDSFVITAKQGVVDAFDGSLNVHLIPVTNRSTIMSDLSNGTHVVYLEVEGVPLTYSVMDSQGREEQKVDTSELNTWGFLLDSEGHPNAKGYLICITCQQEQDPDGLVNQIQDVRFTIHQNFRAGEFFVYQNNGKTLVVRSLNSHWKPNFAEHVRMFREQSGINRYDFVAIDYTDPGISEDYKTAVTYRIKLPYPVNGDEFSTAFGRVFTFLTNNNCEGGYSPYGQSKYCQPATPLDEPLIEIKQQHELAHLENRTKREDVEQDCAPDNAEMFNCDPAKGDYRGHENPEVRKNFLQYDFIEYVP